MNLSQCLFEQLQRDYPKVSPASREQKGLIFGGLVADGFLIVEAERKSAADNLGRVLMREARGLGVADQVIRHSASSPNWGHRGAWQAVRKELIATQADVEQAMIELRDQNFTGELKILPPPTVAHTPLFEKIRAGVNAIRVSLNKARADGLKRADMKSIHEQARKVNAAIRQIDQAKLLWTFALPAAATRLIGDRPIFRSQRDAISRETESKSLPTP
jgi:hypothetical protein